MIVSTLALVTMTSLADFDEWRGYARLLLQNSVQPHEVSWSGPGILPSLFETQAEPIETLQAKTKKLSVPKSFIESAKRVICFKDEERFARLYRVLWCLQTDKNFFRSEVDSDVIWMRNCDKAVRRDRHKMHAFVRFRKVGMGRYSREQFASWFEPSHYITELATPFFMRRFPNMDWVIVTPECTAIWDGKDLRFGPGGEKEDVPAEDAMEDHWRVYFQSIFNPARVKIGAMMSEMPKKYWKNMPEAADIPNMIHAARSRERQMKEEGVSVPNALAETIAKRAVQSTEPCDDLPSLSRAVQSCQRCPLHCHASQAVFGEGPPKSELMIVGEQPGDKEDIAGKPFVGPAGEVLDAALKEVGINRDEAYLTNAVKHFKFKVRGKRRIHERPNRSEIDHCRWWLDKERKLVKPKVIIALGATAAYAVLNTKAPISELRGRPITTKDGATVVVTTHPSYLLRLQNEAKRKKARHAFVQDLSMVKSELRALIYN